MIKEIVWFICSAIGGLLVSLFLYRLLNVELNPVVITAGIIVTLIAVYVVRLTLWVFKESM